MKNTLINSDDAVLLLIDHQSGLFNLVKDMPVRTLRNNVIALAKLAAMQKIPVITTASVPEGPNGPLMPEIQQIVPHAQFIPRHGQINSWEIEDYVKAVENTGRKTLIMAGTVTSVCLVFPALCAKADGYKVYAVIDASGNHSKMATDLAIARLAQAGVIPVDTFAITCELQRTWNRPDALAYANLYGDHLLPNYRLLIESYDKAQSVATGKKN